MARYHGRRGRVYIGTGTGAASSMCTLSEWSLDMSTDKAEVTAFCDENKQYVAGFPDVTGSLAGSWDDTVDTLYDAMKSEAPVPMYLYPSSLVMTKYFYGPAWVDFSISAGVGDAVKISGNFSAGGNWGQY